MSPTHGAITYDVFDEWLVETDIGGAARIVARDVPQWFGQLVEELCAAPPPLDGLREAARLVVDRFLDTPAALAGVHVAALAALRAALREGETP